jgi:hypothetical protein
MTDPLKRRVSFILATAWIILIVADYYFQFFQSRYWSEHALPFLKKF